MRDDSNTIFNFKNHPVVVIAHAKRTHTYPPYIIFHGY